MSDITPPPPNVGTPQPYNYGSPTPPPPDNIMQTAKLGIYGLIATIVGLLFVILQLPFGGFFSLAGLVLAIISLVKKETPKWPAWVTIGLAIAGFIITFLAIVAILALLGTASTLG